MLLHLVQETIEDGATDVAFIGEIEMNYRSYCITLNKPINYSYSGIGSMLRSLSRRGYLIQSRVNRYVGYSLTSSGSSLLN